MSNERAVDTPPTLEGQYIPDSVADSPRERHGLDCGKVDENRLLCDENQALLEEIELALNGLDIALDATGVVGTLVRSRRCHATASQRLEDLRDDLEGRRFVLLLQGSRVFLLELLFRNVQLGVDFFVLCKLHDEERVTGLTLANGRVETDDKLDVDVIQTGQQENAVDGRMQNLVVVGLTTEPQECRVHIEIVSSSACQLCRQR